MHVGDYQLEDTIHIPFTTRAFATGIPTVLAGTPLIDIYEDGSTTQVVVAESLTVDFDSVVGLNLITITATAASGFEAGKSYFAIIEAGTVGGVSVIGEVVGHFTIARAGAGALTELENATDGLSALKTLIDTIDDLLDTEIPAITAAVITNATGADIAADIIALKAETVLILADTGTTLQAELDAIQAAVITNAAGVDIAADIIALKAETVLILEDTGTTLQGELDGIQADTEDLQTQIGTAGAGLTDLGGMSAGMTAEVNAEVVDVLTVDTMALPGQAAPSNTPTIEEAISWLYKAFRNRKTQTATQWNLYNDAQDTIDSKATVSDDATTAIKQEIVSGP